MKRTNFFKSAGTFLITGIFATTFAACDSGERKGSTYEGAEEIVEAEERGEINEPTIGYEDGEYNIDQEYAYSDRELVRNRLRTDIDRADRSLERIETNMEEKGQQVDEATRREWEESKQTLQRERDRLSQRLQEVENSTEQTWDRVRSDVNTTLRDWEKEWDQLKTKDIDADVDVNVQDEYENNK